MGDGWPLVWLRFWSRWGSPGCCSLAYNGVRFGNPFDTGYHFESGEGFTTPIWQGFWGLIFSPYRGVFWHTPLFLASLFAYIPFLRRHRSEGIAIGGLSLILVLVYSAWWMWWGGFAWGPRFLVPLTPFWVLLLAPLLAGARFATRPAQPRNTPTRDQAHPHGPSMASLPSRCWSRWARSPMNFVNYEITLRGLYPTAWDDPLQYGPPAQAITDLLDSPVIGQFRLMRENLVANTDLAWLHADGEILWLVLVIGGAAIATLGGLLLGWWLVQRRA